MGGIRGLEGLGKAGQKKQRTNTASDQSAPPPLDFEPDDGDEVLDELAAGDEAHQRSGIFRAATLWCDVNRQSLVSVICIVPIAAPEEDIPRPPPKSSNKIFTWRSNNKWMPPIRLPPPSPIVMVAGLKSRRRLTLTVLSVRIARHQWSVRPLKSG